MKYLFFDIECANCFGGAGKICEFSYVLSDEHFNELETNQFIVNPDASFDSYVLKNMLAYPESVYISKPKYPFYFEQIRTLFEDKDCMIFGHTVDADAKYLNDEAKRYNLPYFNYKFYDIKEMFSAYENIKRSTSLEKMGDLLGNTRAKHSHRALEDARSTMLAAKSMCDALEFNLLELIALCERCVGETHDGAITTVAKIEAERKRIAREKKGLTNNNTLYGDNYIKFMQFLNGVSVQGEIIESELNGKSLSITMNYQQMHFKEMLGIIQLLKNRDCTYKLKASECDYFVTKVVFDEEGVEHGCSRLKYVQEAIANGKNIKIISFDELLVLLNTTEEKLEKMPMPDESSFLKKKKEKKEKPAIAYSTGGTKGTTIGDILAAKGIVINLNEE